jgi:hypothetical protein
MMSLASELPDPSKVGTGSAANRPVGNPVVPGDSNVYDPLAQEDDGLGAALSP